MGQYVGQSEANLRKALATTEAAHPCVLWIDEIEKAFAGANGSSNSSNDIVMRLMGHFLTWMQERKSAVYIVATANDVMRPEFMRKGRFDEVYFVDFPSLAERIDILNKKIDYYQQDTHQQEIFNLDDLTVSARKNIAEAMSSKSEKNDNSKSNSNGFSGAEIECVVNSVMEKKFIQYLQKEKKDKSSIKVTKQDFLDEINLIKDSVMSNQKGKKDEPTSVERIRSLQEVYKFRLASKL
jgi:SpoVK/Ycf46/Vps4 family AAA+-type ATPase